MRHQGRRVRASLLVVAALLALSGSAAMAQPAEQRKPGARQVNWPRKIPFGEFTVVLDAPQAESLEGTKLKARSTVRVERGDEGEASVATVWLEADVEIDRGRRTVTMVSVEIPRVDFPDAPPARQQRLAARLTQALNRQQPKLSLDDVLASTKRRGAARSLLRS